MFFFNLLELSVELMVFGLVMTSAVFFCGVSFFFRAFFMLVVIELSLIWFFLSFFLVGGSFGAVVVFLVSAGVLSFCLLLLVVYSRLVGGEGIVL